MTTSPVLSITDELLRDVVLACEDSDLYAHGEYQTMLPTSHVHALVEHIRSLTERMKAAEKDAKRFRYIEDDADSGMSRIYGDNWIEVIDAAIAQEGQSYE